MQQSLRQHAPDGTGKSPARVPCNLSLPEVTGDELAAVGNVTDRKNVLLFHRIPREHLGRRFGVVRNDDVDRSRR